MVDVAEQVIPSEQCCVLTSGGYESPAYMGGCVTKVGAWDDKQNLLKGCENGRSSKLTLV